MPMSQCLQYTESFLLDVLIFIVLLFVFSLMLRQRSMIYFHLASCTQIFRDPNEDPRGDVPAGSAGAKCGRSPRS